MSGWSTHKGRAVALPIDNIDTDQLIPARFMSAPRSDGYGQYLLHDLRDTLPDMSGASILIAGRNFGCGSSREAAIYALVDFGIRAVLAPGFGDIFAANAVNNGLLPARCSPDALRRLAGHMPGNLAIDLKGRKIELGETSLSFDLDPVWQQKLIEGWDDIDLTGQHSRSIDAFGEAYMRKTPWAIPAPEAHQ